MLLVDHQIRDLARAGMIEPFEERLVTSGVASWGLSSCGYDARLAPEFMVFDRASTATVIDPSAFDPGLMRHVATDELVVHPGDFVLSRTVEYFRIPRDVFVLCVGKSTWARCGLIVNVTPLEPEWEGHVTLEISNTAPVAVRLTANVGICQFVFLRSDMQPEIGYADRRGKYQGQRGIVPPRSGGADTAV